MRSIFRSCIRRTGIRKHFQKKRISQIVEIFEKMNIKRKGMKSSFIPDTIADVTIAVRFNWIDSLEKCLKNEDLKIIIE